MEVTKSNFNEILPEITTSIQNSTFLAIDCEFSGLFAVSEIGAFDTPKQCYEKIRKNCRDFLVIQYGLSIFRYDDDDEKFKHKTYNFYIFRSPIEKNIPDQRFLCQASSIEFLINHGFDFNKLFKDGISYMNIMEETKCRDTLEEKHNIRKNALSPTQNQTEPIAIPDEHRNFINNTLIQIKDFLKTDENTLELNKCNGFQRKLLYQAVAKKYANKILLQTRNNENNTKILVATKFKSVKEQEEQLEELLKTEKNALDDFLGFTKVLRIITDSGKPVVGHNLCLDFIHTIDKFLTPVPEDYQEFKDCAHLLFPKVLDTKYICTTEHFKDLIGSSILNDLYKTIRNDPFGIPPIEIETNSKSYTLENVKEHEAGYDAFITGLCFISMWKYLEKIGENEIHSNSLEILEPYLNKIHLSILQDNQYINLAGEDLNPSRDHVFYLTFPKEWKLNNIVQLFSPFGSVNVSWINETSAYVGLYKKSQAPHALCALSQSDTYSIMTYSKRQAQLNGTNTIRASPHIKRKRPAETPINKVVKKRRSGETSGSSNLLKRFGPIMEEDEETDLQTTPTSKKTKLFVENNTWN